MRIKHLFQRPSIEDLRRAELQETERALHDAMLQQEYYAHIVPMLQERSARLRAALDNQTKEPTNDR